MAETTNPEAIAKAAKTAFEASQLIPSSERINALHAIAKVLGTKKDAILAANKEDLQVCRTHYSASRK
jgi:glutamate-5-semialdehyde dehydrogenase